MELVVPSVVVLDVVDGVLFVVVLVVVVGEVFDVVLVVGGFVDVAVEFGGSRSGGFLIDKTVHIVMRRIKYFIFDNPVCGKQKTED